MRNADLVSLRAGPRLCGQPPAFSPSVVLHLTAVALKPRRFGRRPARRHGTAGGPKEHDLLIPGFSGHFGVMGLQSPFRNLPLKSAAKPTHQGQQQGGSGFPPEGTMHSAPVKRYAGKFSQRVLAMGSAAHTPLPRGKEMLPQDALSARPAKFTIWVVSPPLSPAVPAVPLAAVVRISMPTGRVVRLRVATGHALLDVTCRAWAALVVTCAHSDRLDAAMLALTHRTRVSIAGRIVTLDTAILPPLLVHNWFCTSRLSGGGGPGKGAQGKGQSADWWASGWYDTADPDPDAWGGAATAADPGYRSGRPRWADQADLPTGCLQSSSPCTLLLPTASPIRSCQHEGGTVPSYCGKTRSAPAKRYVGKFSQRVLAIGQVSPLSSPCVEEVCPQDTLSSRPVKATTCFVSPSLSSTATPAPLGTVVRISMPTGKVVKLWVATGHTLLDVICRLGLLWLLAALAPTDWILP